MNDLFKMIGTPASITLITFIGIIFITIVVKLYVSLLVVSFISNGNEYFKSQNKLADLQYREIEYKKRLYAMEEKFLESGTKTFEKIDEYIESKKYTHKYEDSNI